jgi:hypothetical protein
MAARSSVGGWLPFVTPQQKNKSIILVNEYRLVVPMLIPAHHSHDIHLYRARRRVPREDSPDTCQLFVFILQVPKYGVVPGASCFRFGGPSRLTMTMVPQQSHAHVHRGLRAYNRKARCRDDLYDMDVSYGATPPKGIMQD